jgi:hypothetical protein
MILAAYCSYVKYEELPCAPLPCLPIATLPVAYVTGTGAMPLTVASIAPALDGPGLCLWRDHHTHVVTWDLFSVAIQLTQTVIR